MSTQPAALLQAYLAERQLNFIVDGEDLLDGYPIEARGFAHRFAGKVHVGLRQEQQDPPLSDDPPPPAPWNLRRNGPKSDGAAQVQRPP